MAFQRIRIKNTNVIGKIPGADKLDTAELCINLKDQKLYSKDADGNVFEIGSGSIGNGNTPPGSGNEIGDLWWDGDILLIWNGTDWEPVAPVTSVNGEVGDVVLELGDLDNVAVDGVVDEQVLVYDANAGKWVPASAASLAVDVDLDYTPAPDKGTVTNTAGDDAELPLANATNAGLMSPEDFAKLEGVTEIGDGTLTINDPNGDPLGTFTANQVGNTEVTIPAAKWSEIEDNPITIGGPQPGNPSPGDIWIDLGDCPPTINIWDDCDDPGNPTWKPIGGGGGGGCVQGPVQITSSNGTELNSTLTAVGGNGIDDETTLTATYEWTGAKTGSGSSIVADVEGNYTVTATITCVDGSKLSSSAVWTIADTYVDMTNNTPPVIAVVGGGVDEAYEGNSIYVVTNATVVNGELPSIIETQWFKDGVADGTGSIYTIGADDEGAVITARQLFRDLRLNELLSDASNGITIVERPADVITFNPVITDDGTPQANTPGHVLTASAENIVGGVAPVEYAYEWIVDNLTMGSNKTLNIIQTFVGKVVTCEVTVAEPDGTNPETRTATYAKVIELAGTIDTPEVLAPQDGAGSGAKRYLISDAITEVEGEGVATCETEVIENTSKANYTLSGRVANGNITDVFTDKYTNAEKGVVLQGEWTFNTADFGFSGGTLTSYSYNSTNSSVKYNAFYKFVGEAEVALTPTAGPLTTFTVVVPADKKLEYIKQSSSNHSQRANTCNYFEWEGNRLLNSHVILSFPTAKGFECFEQGDVVQDPDVKVISKTDEAPWEIVVDGGDWTGSDGSGTPGEQTTLVKETSYDTKLTVAGPKDLADMTTGGTVMTDGSGAPGPYSQTPYKLVTTDIESVDDSDPANVILTFPGDVSTNPDLRYFKSGDVVQQPDVKVISTGYPDSNTMVVDGGDWYAPPAKDFTSGVSADAPYYVGYGPEKIFDGDTSTGCTLSALGPTRITIEFTPGIAYTTSIETSRTNGPTTSGAVYCAVNDELDSTATKVPYNPDGNVKTSIRSGAGTINKLVYFNDGASDAAVNNIWVDGVLLKDSIGDSHVEYQTNGGEGEIVSVNTDDNTILLTNTGDRDNRWIVGATDTSGNAGNSGETGDAANAEDFYVAGPSIVDTPLLTADVELKSTNFATTPDGVDTLKNIVWELNGATQDAGLSNPYKPTLNINTTYTVRVKHQGNSLPDSDWSEATTFTTGATRNLHTYYQDLIAGLVSRIEDLENP